MRKLSAFVPAFLLAACELQPPPPRQATPPPAPAAAPVEEAPSRPIAAPSAPGVAPLDISKQCMAIGVHVAGVIVASATDPAQRGVLEQERTRIVRATAEACTTQNWSEAAMKCFLATRNQAEIKDCETKHTAPPPAAPRVPDAPAAAPPPGAVPPPEERHVEPGVPVPGAPPARRGNTNRPQPTRERPTPAPR
jgi:hypothetical protein